MTCYETALALHERTNGGVEDGSVGVIYQYIGYLLRHQDRNDEALVSSRVSGTSASARYRLASWSTNALLDCLCSVRERTV